MKMRAQLYGLIALGMMGMASVSCTSKPEEQIIGKWVAAGGGKEPIEFFRDGTLVAPSPSGNVSGKYAFSDKDRMKLEMGGVLAIAGPVIFKVEFKGNEMVWTSPDGKVTRFVRDRT